MSEGAGDTRVGPTTPGAGGSRRVGPTIPGPEAPADAGTDATSHLGASAVPGDRRTVLIVSPRGQPLMELQTIAAEDDHLVLQGRLMGRFPSRMHSGASETGKLLRKVASLDVAGHLLRWPAFWAAEHLADRRAPGDHDRRADLVVLVVLLSALGLFLGTLGWIAAVAATAGPLLLSATLLLLPAVLVLRGGSPWSATVILVFLVFGSELAVTSAGWATLDQLPLVGLPVLAGYTVAGELIERRGRPAHARSLHRAATVVAGLQTLFVLFQVEPFLEHGVGVAVAPLAGYVVLHALRWRRTGVPAYGLLLSGTLTLAVLLGLTGWTDLRGVALAPPVAVLAGLLGLVADALARLLPPRRLEGPPGLPPPSPRARGPWPLAAPSIALGLAASLGAVREPVVGAGTLLVVGSAWSAAGLVASGLQGWRGTASMAGHLCGAGALALLLVAGADRPGATAAVAGAWALTLGLVSLGSWWVRPPPGVPATASWVFRAGVRTWAARGAAYGAAAAAVLGVAALLGDPTSAGRELLLLLPGAGALVPAATARRVLRDGASFGPPGRSVVELADGVVAAGVAFGALATALRYPGDSAAVLASAVAVAVVVVAVASLRSRFLLHALPVPVALLLASSAAWAGARQWAGVAGLVPAVAAALGALSGRTSARGWAAVAAYAGAATGAVWSPGLVGGVAAVLLLLPQPWGPGERPGRWPRVHELAAGGLVAAAGLGGAEGPALAGLAAAALAGLVTAFVVAGDDGRWSPAVGATAVAVLAVRAASGGAALAAAALAAGAIALGLFPAIRSRSRRGASRESAPVVATSADGGSPDSQRRRLAAGLASLPAVALAGWLWAAGANVESWAWAAGALGLAAAAIAARGGWSLAGPLAGSVPLAGLAWACEVDRRGAPAAAAVAAAAVAAVTVVGARAAWSGAGPGPTEAQSSGGHTDGSPGRLRSAQAAAAAATAPLHLLAAWLVVAGDERAAGITLAALGVSAALAVVLRLPALAALAGADLTTLVFEEARRAQGGEGDIVAIWFLGLGFAVAFAAVLGRVSGADGRRLVRSLAWTGRNRLALAVLLLGGLVAAIGLVVAGVAIVVRDPLVRGGVGDLVGLARGWMDHVAR
ncbi:MAG: hypothetical protein M5U14_21880 [Acidimicrobiia bacterium]|nr:hypothetical protein [Acidimicrobiia bacterium]